MGKGGVESEWRNGRLLLEWEAGVMEGIRSSRGWADVWVVGEWGCGIGGD